MIACVLFPHFAAAVERLADPALGATPLLLGPPPGDPDRVFAACAEAARLGVRPGMPLRQARALCPQARLRPARPAHYRQVFDQLLALLAAFTDRLEPGEAGPAAISYLDLGSPAGTEPDALGRQIARSVRAETGLVPAVGLARGKFPARVAAASAGPDRVLCLAPGQEADFLAPLPVDLLGLDEELARRLHRLGLRTLGQLAALHPGAVLAQFGPEGRRLHRLARGHDERPIRPHRPRPVERVARRFEEPVPDRTVVQAFTWLLAADLAARLQAGGRLGRELRLSLHLEDGTAWTGHTFLRRPTADPERLALALDALLARSRVCCGVAGVALELGDLVPAAGQQLDLFAHRNPAGQARRLRELLPDLLARHGPDCFYQAILTNETALLPEHRFHLRPMVER